MASTVRGRDFLKRPNIQISTNTSSRLTIKNPAAPNITPIKRLFEIPLLADGKVEIDGIAVQFSITGVVTVCITVIFVILLAFWGDCALLAWLLCRPKSPLTKTSNTAAYLNHG